MTTSNKNIIAHRRAKKKMDYGEAVSGRGFLRTLRIDVSV
jgi:hypothetical protein